MVDIITDLLMQIGLATMGHGLIQGLQALQGIGSVLGGVTQRLIETPVALDPGRAITTPQSVGELGPDQWMGIDLFDTAAVSVLE